MRKESEIMIEDNGNQLRFKVRQMPATRLYDFMARALLVLADSGLKLGSEFDLPAAGTHLLENGLQALRGVDYAKAKPLLDELTACCTRISDTGVHQTCTPEVMDGFIDDVRTIVKLQMEAVKVNFGFFVEGRESPSDSAEALSIGRPRTQKG